MLCKICGFELKRVIEPKSSILDTSGKFFIYNPEEHLPFASFHWDDNEYCPSGMMLPKNIPPDKFVCAAFGWAGGESRNKIKITISDLLRLIEVENIEYGKLTLEGVNYGGVLFDYVYVKVP